MKVLWLSNYRFSDQGSNSSGAWIEAMGRGLLAEGSVTLVNVTMSGCSSMVRSDAFGITQYEVPIRKLGANGMPPSWMIRELLAIVERENPDVIHVWGTECFWGLLTARYIKGIPALLEMQGIPGAMVPYMTGGLTTAELRACIGFKELIRPRFSLTGRQAFYREWWKIEQEIIRGHRFIDYESDWVKNYLDGVAIPNTRFFKIRMILRSEFLQADLWRHHGGHRIFSSCGCSANKGTHTLLRAFRFVKNVYPDATLRIAGNLGAGIRTSGYQKWIMREVGNLGLRDSVRFIGPITSSQMVREFHAASVVVVPSYVESYSMSLAEAMAVGCPCAVSYAGAMPEVGGNNVSYFPIADVGACAGAICKLLGDATLAADLGSAAARRSRKMHDCESGVSRQIEIYHALAGR